MINARTAFAAYAVLAALSLLTLNGDILKVALAILGLFAVKTYVDLVRRRMEAREAAEIEARNAAQEEESERTTGS